MLVETDSLPELLGVPRGVLMGESSPWMTCKGCDDSDHDFLTAEASSSDISIIMLIAPRIAIKGREGGIIRLLSN